jgi:hypothetical protein
LDLVVDGAEDAFLSRVLLSSSSRCILLVGSAAAGMDAAAVADVVSDVGDFLEACVGDDREVVEKCCCC